MKCRCARCLACKGKGVVRMEWNERVEYEWSTKIFVRFKDVWCEGCGGRGFVEKGGEAG